MEEITKWHIIEFEMLFSTISILGTLIPLFVEVSLDSDVINVFIMNSTIIKKYQYHLLLSVMAEITLRM